MTSPQTPTPAPGACEVDPQAETESADAAPALGPLAPAPIIPIIDPADQRRYYRHLYLDIAWYGLLSGSSMAFISIYLTRLGADALQISLLNAGPALVGLIFTMPAGRWLVNRPIGRAMGWAAIYNRIGYAIWILLPFLLTPHLQIRTYIILVLLMTIPGTALAVGFNALYAAAVPPAERGQVAGVRNAVLAVSYIATSLISGYILSNTSLQTGYAIVFSMGLVGAIFSTVHLWGLRRLTGREGVDPSLVRAPLGDFASPGSMRSGVTGMRAGVALRVFARGRAILRPEILKTPYGLMVAALFLFHSAQYLPIALFPLMWVNELHFSDQQISIGTATFHLSLLLGSLQLARLTKRRGNLWMMVVGVTGLSLYPLLIASTYGFPLYIVASIVGGGAWALMGGALPNYLLEVAPHNDRPAYLAWYNIALNAGILTGSLAGPLLATAMSIRMGLLAGFVLRAASALAIWAAGRTALRAAAKRTA